MLPNGTDNKPYPCEPMLSGALGIVIVPDQATLARAFALAAEILPKDSEYVLDARSIPHITLYHGKLQSVPASEALLILSEIREILVDQRFFLGPIIPYGGNFVFWNIEHYTGTGPLRVAHDRALSLARFLDVTTEAKASSEEGLTLTSAELENIRQYGHPLIGNQFSPHITLGFHRGIGQSMGKGLRVEFGLQVATVELARIGYPGRIERIVDLPEAV